MWINLWIKSRIERARSRVRVAGRLVPIKSKFEIESHILELKLMPDCFTNVSCFVVVFLSPYWIVRNSIGVCIPLEVVRLELITFVQSCRIACVWILKSEIRNLFPIVYTDVWNSISIVSQVTTPLIHHGVLQFAFLADSSAFADCFPSRSLCYWGSSWKHSIHWREQRYPARGSWGPKIARRILQEASAIW